MENKYPKVPREEIEYRIRTFQQDLKKHNYDGAIILQNVDQYYFTGTMQNALLFIPSEGISTLFVRKSIERAKHETPCRVEALPSMKIIANRLVEMGYSIQNLGLELDVLPYSQFQRMKKSFPESNLVDISMLIRNIRSVKSEYELDMIRNAAKVAYEAIAEVPKILKENMTEIEFAAELEKFVRLNGHLGSLRLRAFNQELFLGMVVSGDAASAPASFDGPAGGQGLSPAMPQGAGWKNIVRNEPILIDLAISINGYVVDQTRTAVIGELDHDLEKAYEISVQILKEIEKKAKPGTQWSEHYLHALKMAEEAGLQDYFMGFKEDQAKFLGHGVGLEIDELPVLAKGLDYLLEEGMVIAVEPKFTFPGKGVVGIENTYVVRKDGLESISYAPEEILKL